MILQTNDEIVKSQILVSLSVAADGSLLLFVNAFINSLNQNPNNWGNPKHFLKSYMYRLPREIFPVKGYTHASIPPKRDDKATIFFNHHHLQGDTLWQGQEKLDLDSGLPQKILYHTYRILSIRRHIFTLCSRMLLYNILVLLDYCCTICCWLFSFRILAFIKW